MKGDRKQYRICTITEWPTDDGEGRVTLHLDKRKFTSRKAAEKRLRVYGSEPWLAFSKGPDDPWCWNSPPCDLAHPLSETSDALLSSVRADFFAGYGNEDGFECQGKHTTAREFFDAKRDEMVGQLLEVWLEERTVSPWSRVATEGGS